MKAALIGAGSRGMFAYGAYALKHPNEIQFIAVADSNEEKRTHFAHLHAIPTAQQYTHWDDLLAKPKLCDTLFICTQDTDHYEPVMKAMQAGYDIVLEKPMSPDPLETLRLAEEAERLGCGLTVCHVLRYDLYFNTLKKLVDRKEIGDLVSIQWSENIGYWHFAHSFVRGNWRKTSSSSAMILAKCCHDLDLIQWLAGGQCTSVSSFGELSYFRERHAPLGSTDRCTDGCAVEPDCPYSALKLYYNDSNSWPQDVVSLQNDLPTRWKALQEGPYGRCVFRCDNDVVDHQAVNMQFDNGVTVSFNISAFSSEITRTFKIMGTLGEITGHRKSGELEIVLFNGQKERIIPASVEGGHGGADTMLMREIVRRHDNPSTQSEPSRSSGMVSAESHLIAFAAEHSRLTGENVRMEEFVQQLRRQVEGGSRDEEGGGQAIDGTNNNFK